MKKTISVLMATYNGAEFIRAQLDSIVKQTIYPDEIIIMDDCSSDETLLILQEYQNNYPNFKIIVNSHNLGAARTFFAGIRFCSSQYIAFADQDDIWLPNKLEVLIKNIGDNLLIYSSELLMSDNSVIHSSNHSVDFAKLKFWDYLLQNRVRGCCAMISHAILQYDYPDNFYIHDHYFALLAANLDKIKFIPDKLVIYRQHSQNAIGAGKYPFDKFIANSVVVANSFELLLNADTFAANYSKIQLMRDYRVSLASGDFLGLYKIIKLLKHPHGIKLVIYYLLVGRLLGDNISRKIYNFIHHLK